MVIKNGEWIPDHTETNNGKYGFDVKYLFFINSKVHFKCNREYTFPKFNEEELCLACSKLKKKKAQDTFHQKSLS